MGKLEIKYLIDGSEVLVIEKTTNGYIIQRIYDFDECDECNTYGDMEFVDTVYDTVPTVKFDEAIVSRQKTIEELAKKINELVAEKNNLQSLAEYNKKSLIDEQLYKFLTGEYKYVLELDNYKISSGKLSDCDDIHVHFHNGNVNIFKKKYSDSAGLHFFDDYMSAIKYGMSHGENVINSMTYSYDTWINRLEYNDIRTYLEPLYKKRIKEIQNTQLENERNRLQKELQNLQAKLNKSSN